MSTLTSANSKFALTIRDVAGLPIVGPFNVEGYATDDAFAVDPVESAMAQMGVDGRMSAGFLPAMTKQNVMLQADSPSRALFEQWMAGQEIGREVLYADGVLTIPSIGNVYTLVKGVLTRYSKMPAAKSILQPMSFEITWESVIPVPLAL